MVSLTQKWVVGAKSIAALCEGISSRGEKRGSACQPFAFGRTQDSGNGKNLCRPSPSGNGKLRPGQ